MSDDFAVGYRAGNWDQKAISDDKQVIIDRLTADNAKLRAALTKLETEIRNRGDAERMYIELIEAALANEQDTK